MTNIVKEEQNAVRTCFEDNQHRSMCSGKPFWRKRIHLRYKGWYAYLGLDMQNCRVNREQGKESKDIQYDLGTTDVMLDEKEAREKS